MSKWKYPLYFATCVYSGIAREIKFAISNDKECKIERLQELVDRYNEEYMVSSAYLYELLDEYKEKWSSK